MSDTTEALLVLSKKFDIKLSNGRITLYVRKVTSPRKKVLARSDDKPQKTKKSGVAVIARGKSRAVILSKESKGFTKPRRVAALRTVFGDQIDRIMSKGYGAFARIRGGKYAAPVVLQHGSLHLPETYRNWNGDDYLLALNEDYSISKLVKVGAFRSARDRLGHEVFAPIEEVPRAHFFA